MRNLGKVITAMVTPLDDNLKVDLGKTRKLARYLVENGSDGIVVTGTTGESPTMSKEEKISLFKTVKDEVGESITVIAGAGSNSTEESILLSKAAQKAGVDCIMLVVPYYNKPSQEGLYQHFSTIAKEVELPIMLYNVPGRTVTNMLPETVERLAAIDNIVALKEACGSMDQVSELKRILPEDFYIYSGDDSLTLPMLSLGCEGVVSVASHLVGKEIKEMIELFKAGSTKEALVKHLTLMPIFKMLFITANPVPLKYALRQIGLDVGGVRGPLCNATKVEEEIINKVLLQFKMISAEL